MGGFAGVPAPPTDFTDAGADFGDLVFNDMEVEQFLTLSPLPDVPADPTNAVADLPAAAVLGQKLFFDPRASGPLKVASDLGAVGETGKVACVTCHWGPYMDDQRSVPSNVSLGADFHTRNALTTINSSFYRWTNWGGRFSAQWEITLPVTESGAIMNSSRLAVAHLLFDEYKDAYEEIFGAMEPEIGTDRMRFPPTGKPAAAGAAPGAWESMTTEDQALVNEIFVNYGKAIQAYLRKLVSRNAPFDQFVAGVDNAIDDEAKRGLKLFLGRGRCVSCHYGPQLSDNKFHTTGVPQQGEHVPSTDTGRNKDIIALLASPFNSAGAFSDDTTTGRLAGLTNPPPDETLGQFRTPSLRGVALTAPYMHSGQLATLEDVLSFYDHGGSEPAQGVKDPLLTRLFLSEQDKADLVAFLQTLTGDPVPAALLQDQFEPVTPMEHKGPW
jgi:cytochrome c peroxidase